MYTGAQGEALWRKSNKNGAQEPLERGAGLGLGGTDLELSILWSCMKSYCLHV